MFLPRVLAARDIVGAALSPEAEPVLVARVNSLIPQTTAVMVANVLINLAISSTSMALLSSFRPHVPPLTRLLTSLF